MELLTPSSEIEDKVLREKILKSGNAPSSLHMGVSSMNNKEVWYSIDTGKIWNFDFEWSHNSDPDNSNC